jgi:hypothetical protein
VRVELAAPSTRPYEPEIGFFELQNRSSQDRFQVNFSAKDGLFVLTLPAGEYELVRVQIAEGAFRAMAGLLATFRVDSGGITYVGTWVFLVDSPRTRRMMTLSVALERSEAEHELFSRFPALAGRPTLVALPIIAVKEARLYEVSAYPRYRYFHRQF